MANVFLTSVNIREDLVHPSRLSHYHPTSRSLPLVKAVMTPGATMAIASYGSGKSLAAGVGALAILNDGFASSHLSKLADRMRGVDGQTAAMIDERLTSGKRGKVVVLAGYVSDPAEQIRAALGIESRASVRSIAAAIRRGEIEGIDHVAIVWDEFGRHLESLVRDARAKDLEIVQDLAELAVRSETVGLSLTLLLHQNLLVYAQNLNQTSRSEWRKIEGRFRLIRFVEDSRELYSLAAKLCNARSTPSEPFPVALEPEIVSRAIVGRWFDDTQDATSIGRLIKSAWPLSAAALQVLPRLVARVGQNERSLFTFISSADLTRPVGMDEVYEAFSELIRSDIGIGGLHRQWVEAESARSRTDDVVERELLAAAFLLQAGASGERRHLKRSVLVGAALSRGIPLLEAEAALSALIDRKLLIHRKLNDEVSVWHGADVDVASRLRDERAKIGSDFDLVEFLQRQHKAPFIRPVRHNTRYGVSRHFSGVYVAADGLPKYLSREPVPAWGRVVYVVASTGEQVTQARSVASEQWPGTVLVVPADPLPLWDAALEIEALLSLRRDEEFLSQDPLVVREVDELLTVSRRQLAVLIHRLTTDRPQSSEWWYEGEKLPVDADRPAGIVISNILDDLFGKTPRVSNDQIVRTRLSRAMTTARLRMLTRLMGQPEARNLGYGDDDGSAEASVYRTTLVRTGLHLLDDDCARFATPEEISDPGLAEIWAYLHKFFTEKGRRSLSEVVATLSSPPYGVHAGLMPILVMAGFKAFARAVAIRTDGIFVRDMLGFDAGRVFNDPEKTEFEVYGTAPALLSYLDRFAHMFLIEHPAEFDERITFANMALEKWVSSIAEGARRSKRMPENARQLLRAIQAATDPPTLIVKTLPELLGPQDKQYLPGLTYVLDQLHRCRNSIDGLVEGYLRDAVNVMEDVLHLDGSKKEAVDGVLEWVACFDVEALSKRQDLKMTDLTILKTIDAMRSGRYSAEGMARVSSQILIKRGIDKWQDDTKEFFRKELREARERVEAAALDTEQPSEKLVPVIESRMRYLQDQLARIRKGAPGVSQ